MEVIVSQVIKILAVYGPLLGSIVLYGLSAGKLVEALGVTNTSAHRLLVLGAGIAASFFFVWLLALFVKRMPD